MGIETEMEIEMQMWIEMEAGTWTDMMLVSMVQQGQQLT